MYIAMNHFRIAPENSEAFEQVWRDRTSYLSGVPGFVGFHLLKGPLDEQGAQLYASHTTWSDEASFRAWTESDAFRKAHSQARTTGSFLLGPPKFVGWHAVL